MVTYQPRIADGELSDLMEAAGAVLIEGKKACGKTATATRRATTVFRLDTDDSLHDLVDTAPELLPNAAPLAATTTTRSTSSSPSTMGAGARSKSS